jgi:Xaa-Pro aminopeptidase
MTMVQLRVVRFIPAFALLLAAAGACAPPGPAGAPAPRGQAAFALPPIPPATPISAAEFAERRQALMARLEDGVFVAFGAPAPPADYMPYAQSPDFRYLTGITEPSAGLIIVKSSGRTEELLFVQDRDPAREVWEGARLGPDGARALTGIRATTSDAFVPALDSLARRHGVLYTLAPVPAEVDIAAALSPEQQVLSRLRAATPALRIQPVNPVLARIRARKSPAELDLIRRAVYISVLAHREAMRATEPGMNEFEIKGLLEYYFLRLGAEGPAYSSIVGSGPNSTTLHYRAADRFMNAGEVLLIDAAAMYRGYAADVTRTFPVNGRFTPEQRAVYEVVLAAQTAAEAQIRQGATWNDLNLAANREISEGLARLGLIDAADAVYDCPLGTRIGECPQYRMFYMHGLGHGVGLAVHDPDISTIEHFQPGSAVTIEPGIYVRGDVFDYLPDTARNRAMIARLRPVMERYRYIGVRIEDVFLFGANGVERASAGVPREIAEIEALMREPASDPGTRRPDIVEWYRQTGVVQR